jgi:Trk K+ transport system NAD-binding subunit
VIHKGTTVIPTGDTAIEPRDNVGLVLSKERIAKLESIFGS